ncbi:hypothetical protein [Haloferax sp. DFSO60]|uniref:hypothetical protein n=1 Tax=Haloferax sp. DFSO60 TaxID=3388652 RepID=UPI00397A404A
MLSAVTQVGPELPAAFQLVVLPIPLLIAVFALVMAVFPRRMTQWQMRGPDGTTQIEPSQTRILVIRVGGVVVAAIALGMAFMTSMILF